MDPLLQKGSESNSDLFPDSGEISTGITPSDGGVQAPNFRAFLRNHNTFINDKDPSTELVNRAKEIGKRRREQSSLVEPKKTWRTMKMMNKMKKKMMKRVQFLRPPNGCRFHEKR